MNKLFEAFVANLLIEKLGISILLDTKNKGYADDPDMAHIAQQGNANNHVGYLHKVASYSLLQR
jgi:hypothetical protein